MEWKPPDQILVKELDGRLVEYVPNTDEEEIFAEALPEGTIVDEPVVHAAAVHTLPDPIVESKVQAEHENEDNATITDSPPPPPVNPPVVHPPALPPAL